MWLGFIVSRAIKADDEGELLPKQSQYVGQVNINDEDLEEQAADSGADAAPSVPAALVKTQRQMPTAHDLAGKFTTPDKDTGVGHKGKNLFDHMGNRKGPANNSTPSAGAF